MKRYPDSMSIAAFAEEAEVSCRVANCMRNFAYDFADVTTLGQLRELGDGPLLRIPNFGKKSLRELRSVLAETTGPGFIEDL